MRAALLAVLELNLGEDERVTTVNWERMSGDDVELFVAAALTKGRGGGGQITPSTGDGGIDVLLPMEDGKWEVVQVKRYSRPLDSKQKKSVEASWDRFLQQRLDKHEFAAWTLAMPLDPTREALEWLQALPPEAPFAKTWMGRTQLDILAAENPQLVDYYFGDGAARVQQLLTTGIEAGRPTTGLSENDLLAGVFARHEALAAALDELDPFYTYEISTRHGQVPTNIDKYVAEADGTVMVRFQTIDAERYSVMRVIPTHPLAGLLRPIKQTVRFETQPGSREHQMLKDFETYGVPFENIAGDVVEAVGPPGTSRTGRALFSFAASVNESMPPIELRASAPDGKVVAVLPMRPPETSSGLSGERFWLTTKDLSGLVTLDMRIGGTDKLWELNLRHGSLTGQPAVEVSRVGDFYQALRPEQQLTLARVGGKELMAPFHLSTGSADDLSIWRLVDLYSRLQRHTHDAVVLPDLGQVDLADVAWLENIVRALDGEKVELRWQTQKIPVPAETIDVVKPFIDSEESFESIQVFEIPSPLCGVTVRLPGRLAICLLSCRINDASDPGDETSIELELSPAVNDRAVLMPVDDTFAVGHFFGTSLSRLTDDAS